MLIVLWFAYYVPVFSQIQKGNFKYWLKFFDYPWLYVLVYAVEKIEEKIHKNNNIIIIYYN